MNFTGSSDAISGLQIAACEEACGVRLPLSLRECYQESNGGQPEPYVFENDHLDTVVSEFLPLSTDGRGGAVKTYLLLVRERKIVPSHFFPFAVDGGGEYFFVDTKSEEGAVYFFRSDSNEPGLLPLNLGVREFWQALKPE